MKNFFSMYLLYVLLFFFLTNLSFASEKEYSIKEIPAGLSLDADALIRNKTIKFEIKDEASAVMEKVVAVTVFNKEGQHHGELSLEYDDFINIDELNGKILDANGDEVRELNSKDIKDYPAISGYSLYEDSRVKEAQLYYDRYPYTVVFNYKISYDGYLNWPSWYSRNSLDPVELTKFEVHIPENYKLRYWCNDKAVKPEISAGERIYSWHAENLPKLSFESVGEDVEDVAAIVKIAPSNFEIEGYKGNMNSWKDFGLWVNDLYKDKNVLTPEIIKQIESIISPNDNEKLKVEKLYKYMQSRTRYVSVQLGVGAWQPFDAMYVHQRGYGDCKALSNYMVSLLKATGITAYPVLINNGDHRLPLITEFPSNQFNHVIVCVPLQKDTIWLECTSQNALAGSIGWSNENRDALMITPSGGIIVKTPSSLSEHNLMLKNVEVSFSSASALIKCIIDWSGNQQHSVRDVVKNEAPEDQEKWILNAFEVPDVKIGSYSFKLDADCTNHIKLNLNISLPKYASVSSSRIFFNPNIMERRSYVPDAVTKRLSPIRFSYPYHDIDSIHYKIPDGYKVEALPENMDLVSSFGNFSSKLIKNGEKELLYIRSLELRQYQIPAENYNEYRNFFASVVKADRSQVVLVKSN